VESIIKTTSNSKRFMTIFDNNCTNFSLPPYQINYTVGYVHGVDIYSGYDELVPKGIDFFGRNQEEKVI
jgi:hypothetical protein